MPSKNKNPGHNHTSVLLLRAGLAFVFLYAAVSSWQQPLDWAGYLPQFLLHHFNATTLIKVFATYEIALSIWLITGKYLRYSAFLTTLTLAGIVLSTPHQLIVTFRDIGLAFAALSLVFIDK